ncbi:MAG TPA: ethylbenzene dehydrogenase-related protein [Anaerolineae bacterium]|nr:ethylbenzene dehydrogenase-related protein [Anaerolineae bacterium]
MCKKLFINFSLCVALIVGSLQFTTGEAMGASRQTLTAVRAKSAPLGSDDAVWGKAKGQIVPFEGKEQFAGKKASVTTKAVYTDDSIYFLFKWKDPTLSVTKDAWEYDGSKWSHRKGNEDRIALLFEINRINNYATKGCAILCHVPQGASNAKDGKFGTSTAAEMGDLWHWKAARSDPEGFADDTWLTQISAEKGGRKNDNGKGGDRKNMTEDKSRPKFMLAPGKTLAKHGILLASHAVEITNYSDFKAGDVLTYQMPETPEGSRGDIKAVSRHADGSWTVMLYRKLDTGNEDDAVFNPRKKYNFTMALFDDSGDENSYDSEVITLSFKK